ncbi:hypothetical protein CNR22_10520 [Sphingobacteriaceae bacterium]|nr:hypothetical protein CNR22_10520 [Sphingobacteriaceae bacterium]
MKNLFLLSAFAFILILTSCGPAAENRQVMHERAKVFQDSIANMIRTSMAEAEAPGGVVVQPAPAATPAPAPAKK